MAAPETGLLDGRLLPGRIPDDHVESLATAEENLGKRDREVKDRGDGDRWDEAAELTEASSSDGPGGEVTAGRGHACGGDLFPAGGPTHPSRVIPRRRSLVGGIARADGSSGNPMRIASVPNRART